MHASDRWVFKGDVPASVDLIRAVYFVLYALENTFGNEMARNTVVHWVNGENCARASIECALVRTDAISRNALLEIHDYDPILFESWLSSVVENWLRN